MRSSDLVISFFSLISLVAGSAPAEEMRWEGTLEATFNLRLGEPIKETGTGVADVEYMGASLRSIRFAGGITGSMTVPVTDPETSGTIPSIRVSIGVDTGKLSPFNPFATPQLTNNTLGLGGRVRVCMLTSSCTSGITLDYVTRKRKKGVGIGGMWNPVGFGSVRISIESAPWTILTASLSITTTGGDVAIVKTYGFAHGPFSFEGSVAETGGVLSTVVPMRIEGDLEMAGFIRQTIRFVPEPSFLPLIGSGVVGLGLMGRRRMKSQ